jgi:hypothetical protein
MAHRGTTRGIIEATPTALLVALIAVRVLVAGVVIADAGRHGVDDPVVLRVHAVASSPASPWKGFPVASMPVETALMHVVGGDSPTATAVRMALLAFIADLAVFVGVAFAWGRRAAGTYLLLALPLLPMVYRRLDLVSVALATWGAALLTRRGDAEAGGPGIAFALGIWTKLWPLVLLPALLLRRAQRSLIAAAGLVLIGGIVWFFVGGKKAPFQVLTLRDAVGWSVEGTVGSALRAFGLAGPSNPDGNTARFGTVPELAEPLLFMTLLALLGLIWWGASREPQRDPFGATSIAAVTALLVCAPLVAAQYVSWLVPWTAVAFEADEPEREVAVASSVAIVLTGLTQLVTVGEGWVDAWLLFARNLTLVAVVGLWLVPALLPRRPEAAHAA